MPLISTGYGYRPDDEEEEERTRKWVQSKLPPLPSGGIQPRMKPPTEAETVDSVVRMPAVESRQTVAPPPAASRITDSVTRTELTAPVAPLQRRDEDEDEPTPDRYDTGPSGGIPVVGNQGVSAPGYAGGLPPWQLPGQQQLPPVAIPVQPYAGFTPLPTPSVSNLHETRGVMFPRQGGQPTGAATPYGDNLAGRIREQGLGPALRETGQEMFQNAGQSDLVQGLRTPEGRQFLLNQLGQGAAAAFSPSLMGLDPNNPQAGVYANLEQVAPGEKPAIQQRFDEVVAGQYFNEIQARREAEIAANSQAAGEADLKWWQRTKPMVWIQRFAETSWRTVGSLDADELAYLAFGESPISNAPEPGERRGPTLGDTTQAWTQPLWERVRFRVGKRGPEYDPVSGTYSSPWNKDWRVLDYFNLRPDPKLVAEVGVVQANVETLLARTDQLLQAREQLRTDFENMGQANPELYADLAAIQAMAYTDAYRSQTALDVALSVPYWKQDLAMQRDQLRVQAAQLEAAQQYEQAERVLVEAGRVGAFLNELENTSTADIVEHYTNYGAELASSPLDPLDYGLGKAVEGLGLGLKGLARLQAARRLGNMTGETATENIARAAARGEAWVQAAQTGSNIGQVFTGLGKRVQRAAQESGPVEAVKELLILPANTPATRARNSTEILSNTLSMMMSNSSIENKSVVREILSRMATPDGRRELVDGIMDPLGNEYTWGPGLIGNVDVAREYKVLDMMGPRWVDDLESLAGDGAVNMYELQSEITLKLHDATRHMYGATRDSVLPWRTSSVRLGRQNGRAVVEYLDDNGQLVRRSQPMSQGQAAGILEDAQKALARPGTNPFKVIAKVRNAIMSDMFLALRPANAVRQSTAQTLMMQAYDAYSTVGHREIVRRMSDMFEGGAPTIRMLEGMGAFSMDSRGIGGYGAIDWIAQTITRNPENAVSRFMRKAYGLPYGHSEIRLGKYGIGIGDDAQNEKVFFSTMQKARNTMWPEYVRGAWDNITAEAGLSPEQSKALRQLVESEGKIHNKAAIQRAVDNYLQAEETPNLLASLEIPDDVITPEAQRQIERVLQNANPEDREIVARRVARIFDQERKRYREMLGLARPDFEEIPWTNQEIAHGAADIADMLREDARKGGIPEAEAQRTAERIAGQWARQQRAAVDSFRSSLADTVGRQAAGGRAASAPGGGPPPIGRGLWDAAMDFWRDVYDTRVAARLEVDEASRRARSLGTSQAWAQKFRETSEIWDRFGREFADISDRYGAHMRSIADGNPYQGKTSIDDILHKYVMFDEDEWKRVQQIELGGVNDTGEDLWQQVIDYHRDYLDNAFTEVAMAFRRFPSVENFDVMIQAMRQVDEMGSRAAEYVATHRAALLAGRLKKGEFYQIRNLTWNQFFREAAPESLRYMERAIIMNGLLEGEGMRSLRWTDDFAGRYQLNRPLGQGIWEAINIDTGDMERLAEPGRLQKYPPEPRGAGFARSEITVKPDTRENMIVVPQEVIDRYLAMTDNAASSVDDVAEEIRRDANKVAPVLPDDQKEAISATQHPMKPNTSLTPAAGYFDADTAIRQVLTPTPLERHLDVMDWVSNRGLANQLAATDRAAAWAKLRAETRGPAEFLSRAVEASRVGPLFGGQLPDQPARELPSYIPRPRELENLATYAGYATADRRGRGNQMPRILNSARAAGVPIPKNVNSFNSLTDSEALALGVFLQNRAATNMRQIYRTAWAQILPEDQLAAHMNLADAHAAADARITGRHPSQWWAENIAGMTRTLPSPETAEETYRRLYQAGKLVTREQFETLDWDEGSSWSPATAWAYRREYDAAAPDEREVYTLADYMRDNDQWNLGQLIGQFSQNDADWQRFHSESRFALDQARQGRPVYVYRASGYDHPGILPGSYVTTSRSYAEFHGNTNLRENFKLYQVAASPDELVSVGDSHEFLYMPRNPDEAYRKYVAQGSEPIPTYRRLYQEAYTAIDDDDWTNQPQIWAKVQRALDPNAPAEYQMQAPGDLFKLLGDPGLPEYLQEYGDFLQAQLEKLLRGDMTKRDLVKAYIITVASQGASLLHWSTVQNKFDELHVTKNGQRFIVERRWMEPSTIKDGDPQSGMMRIEDVLALWMQSDMGQAALDAFEAGTFDTNAWAQGLNIRGGQHTFTTPDGVEVSGIKGFGDDRLFRNNVTGEYAPLKNLEREGNLSNIAYFDAMIEAAKRSPEEFYNMLDGLKGVGPGKKPFIGQLLGWGRELTMDVREYMTWFTGHATAASAKKAGVHPTLITLGQIFGTQNLKTLGLEGVKRPGVKPTAAVREHVAKLVDLAAQTQHFGPEYSADIAGALVHHRIWDAINEGAQTEHRAILHAMQFAQQMPLWNADLPAGLRVRLTPSGDYQVINAEGAKELITYGWGTTAEEAIVNANRELVERAKVASLRSGRPISAEDVLRRPDWVAGVMGEAIPGDIYGTDTLSRVDRMQGRRLWVGRNTSQEFDFEAGEWVISYKNQEIGRSSNRYNALKQAHSYQQNTPGVPVDFSLEYAYRNLQDAILEGTARGAVTFLEDGRAVISALNQPDLSTAVHEMSHVWLNEIQRKASQYEEYADMWQKIRQAYEIGPEPLTRARWTEIQERWATDFERYLQDGKAPTKYLQHIFDQFKRWMFDIYRKLVGSGEVHPEIRKVFDSLLASDEEIAAYQTVDRGFEDLPLFLRSGEDPLEAVAPMPAEAPPPVTGVTRTGQGEMFGSGEDLPMFTGQGMAADVGEFTPEVQQQQGGMFDMRPRMGNQEPSYIANSLEPDPPPLPPDDVLQEILAADVEFTAGTLARYPDGSLWWHPETGMGGEFKQAMDAGNKGTTPWKRVSRPMNTAGGKESATARKLRAQVDEDLLPQYPWEYLDLNEGTAPQEWVNEAADAMMLEALRETAEEMRTRYIEEGKAKIKGAWTWDRLIKTAKQKDLVQGQSGRRIADRDTGQFAERAFEGGRIAEQGWFRDLAGEMFPSTGSSTSDLIEFINDYLDLERRIADLESTGSEGFTRMSAREIAQYGIDAGLYDEETAEQWIRQGGREGIINLTTAAEDTPFEGLNMAWELPSKTRLNKMRKAELSQVLVENQIVTAEQAGRSSKRELVQLAEEARQRPMSERAGGRQVGGYTLYQQSADAYMDLNPQGPIPPWQQAWMAMRSSQAAPPRAQGTPGGQFRHQLHMLNSAEQAIMGQLDNMLLRQPNTLTQGQRSAVRNGVSKLLPGHDDIAASAAMQGKFVADWILPNNYERRYFDNVLSLISPFHYFTTRAAIRGAHAAMQSPWLLDLYYRGERAIEKRNDRDPQATRTSNAIQIGGVQLPNGETYTLSLGNPLSWIVPYSMYAPNPYVEPDAARNEFERWYYKMMRWSPVRPGPFSQMAMGAAGIGDEPQLMDLVPLARMGGYAQMARNGIIGGPGVLRLGDEWDYGRAGREIALMVERGEISPAMAAWAQDVGYQILNQTGPLPGEPEEARQLWEQGVQRMAINRGVALLAGWMLGVPIYTYSDVERDIRAKAQTYRQMGYQGPGQPLGAGSLGGSRTAQKAYLQEIDQVLRPWWAYRVLYPGEVEQQQPAPQRFYYKQPTEEFDRPAVQAQRIEYYDGRDAIYEGSGEMVKAWIEANPVTAETDIREHRSQFRDFQDQVYALQTQELDDLRAQYGNEITEYNTTYDMMRNMDPDEINRRIGEQAYREAKDELADLRPPEADWDSLADEDRRALSGAWDMYNDAVDRLMAAKLNDRQWLIDTTWGRPLGTSAAESAEARLQGREAEQYDVPGVRMGPSYPMNAELGAPADRLPMPPATAQPDVPYGQQFATAAMQYDLDPKMLAAVALAESSFDPSAVSRAGARGLMQIMPDTWQQAVDAGLAISDPMNATHSIAAGAYYLDWLKRTLPEDKKSDQWVLAAYNWGPGNVIAAESWRDVPAETRAYTQHVLNESGRMLDAESAKAEAARQEALSLRKPFDGDYVQTQAYGASPEAYSRFGLTGHDGIDWSMPEGTPVAAAADGIVERIGWDPNGYGTYMVVNHGGGYSTLYAHLSNTQLQQGQPVLAGDVIALSGNTGNSTGPHLHMGLIVEGSEGGVGYNRQDPSPYLQQLATGGGSTQLPTGQTLQAPVQNAGDGQIVRSTAPPWQQTQQAIRDRYGAKFQTPEQRALEQIYDQFDANEATRIDGLYPGGSALREQYSQIVSDEDRAAFKAANPEINLINLATYNQTIHDEALDLFGAAAMQEWARRPDWTQTEARREYYRQHPRSWTVNAWLTGRPDDAEAGQDEFSYNAGRDYEQARQMFGQDIFSSYERYLSLDKDGRRAYAKSDGRIYDFQDWWYELLNDEGQGAGSGYAYRGGYGGWYGGGGYGGSSWSGADNLDRGTPSQYYPARYREMNYDLQPQAAGRAGLGAWRQWDVDRPYVPDMRYPDVRLWQPRIG